MCGSWSALRRGRRGECLLAPEGQRVVTLIALQNVGLQDRRRRWRGEAGGGGREVAARNFELGL